MPSNPIVIVSAVRTPLGRFQGDLSPVQDFVESRDYYSEGQFMTHLCKEEIPFESRAAVFAFGDDREIGRGLAQQGDKFLDKQAQMKRDITRAETEGRRLVVAGLITERGIVAPARDAFSWHRGGRDQPAEEGAIRRRRLP